MRPSVRRLAAAAVLSLAPAALAHDLPGSTDFDLQVPPGPYSGEITFATLIGPEAGLELLHTTWNITFQSGPGGTLGSDVQMELTMPLQSGFQSWVVTGADFGWPNDTGTFSATLGSDQLNGVLAGGLFPISTPSLDIGATTGGLTGQFLDSTITLEIAGGEVCQTDLGFDGPGDLTLAMCGDPLATGGTADVVVENGPPAGVVYLVLGLTNQPTPFFGGTLVPVPPTRIQGFVADAAGTLTLTVPGGGGPVTGYLQAVAPDAGQPAGYEISNALEIDVLP